MTEQEMCRLMVSCGDKVFFFFSLKFSAVCLPRAQCPCNQKRTLFYFKETELNSEYSLGTQKVVTPQLSELVILVCR